MRYAIYELSSGKILRTLLCPDSALSDNVNDGESALLGGCNVLLDYVDGGKFVRRPEQVTVLDGTTLRQLPVPCTIQINCTVYPCEDSEAELGFDQYGVYKIRVRSFPYLDKEFSYEYPAPP